MHFHTIPIIFCLISNTAVAATSEFKLCYDFGCKSSQDISFDVNQWSQLEDIFTPRASTEFQEKQMIRQAIALMEQFSGQLAGTYRDKGGNYTSSDIPQQMDCIDESTNTLQYLKSLKEHGYLVFHKVSGKKRRIVWFATHWTAVIEQLDTDQKYAVDSWYRDNGKPPYLQLLTNWQKKSHFSDALNPELELFDE